ncbi:flagellar motor protein [Algiphilus sp.]|uniref:flagellar motor protein n=1 Tax=Algiphilus sp. TaxID=1872431 RepID=UPI001CA719DC|nr:flagellar motor protein [Algiphilus sp.]MBY8966961.1 flagellar motor protein [Algiphilus acroporae]MCI5062365.1 flagellar motor protein [Algiphilus sp.]MCI5103081.1 flagellar motor protein [Algiphilus sp.]
MDKMTPLGLILAAIAVVGGSVLKGSGVMALLSGAAFVIVLVGTVASICIHTPPATLKHAMKIFKWIFRPPVQEAEALINEVVEWSNLARKQGLLALEPAVEEQSDPFIKKGLQLLVDGSEPDVLRSTLEVEIDAREHGDNAGAKVFEGMGIYAPTLGIIGAVLGLMAVMQNLADPSKLGKGIAAAFVATIYGIGAANLFFLPVAAKLKAVIADQTRTREMVVEGLVGIARGDNPRNIEARLRGFLH